MDNYGKFFALEGIDGSGKTTQIPLLVKKLEEYQQNSPTPLATQEPTKSPIGLLLRDILTGTLSADPRVVSSLFATDRLNHILEKNGLLAQLQQGITVISDRYYFSSYAYHSIDQDLDKIIEENRQNSSLLRPTATIFLDISPDIAMRRILENRVNTELFETQQQLEKIYKNYFLAFERLKEEEKIIIIDANCTKETLTQRIFQEMKYFL